MAYGVMPHSKDAEEAYLGCLLINPSLVKETDISPDDFYILRNRDVFESMRGVFAKDGIIDILTVSEELDSRMGLLTFSRLAKNLIVVGNCPKLADSCILHH